MDLASRRRVRRLKPAYTRADFSALITNVQRNRLSSFLIRSSADLDLAQKKYPQINNAGSVHQTKAATDSIRHTCELCYNTSELKLNFNHVYINVFAMAFKYCNTLLCIRFYRSVRRFFVAETPRPSSQHAQQPLQLLRRRVAHARQEKCRQDAHCRRRHIRRVLPARSSAQYMQVC